MSLVWRFHSIHMSPLSIFKPLFEPKLCRFFKRVVLYPFFSWYGVQNTIPYIYWCDVKWLLWFAALPRLYDSHSLLLYHQAKLYMMQISADEKQESEQSYKRSYCRFHTLHCINIVTWAVWSGMYGESLYITETEHNRFLTAHIVWSRRRPTHFVSKRSAQRPKRYKLVYEL